MTLSVSNTNLLSLFPAALFLKQQICLQKIPDLRGVLSDFPQSHNRVQIIDDSCKSIISVSKTTKELQLQWKMDVDPVQLSPEVKMPQFIVRLNIKTLKTKFIVRLIFKTPKIKFFVRLIIKTPKTKMHFYNHKILYPSYFAGPGCRGCFVWWSSCSW